MVDEPELSPAAAGDRISSDEETIKEARDDTLGETTQSLEDETPDAIGNGSVSNRYRELLEAQADENSSSEDGSADALPRRAGSPIDSQLSGPDDSPSLQVCAGPPCGAWDEMCAMGSGPLT